MDLSTLQGSHEELSFLPIQKHGKLVTYSHTESPQLASRAGDAEVVITIKNRIFAEELDQMPRLKLLCRAGAGVDNFDIEAARSRKITVCNLPDYGSAMVAQWTFGFILGLANQFVAYDKAIRTSDDWKKIYFSAPSMELRGKTLGIIGLGRIGKQVAALAACFGMRVLVHTTSTHNSSGPEAPYSFVDLDVLAAESDFVSIHCPLTLKSQGMIGPSFFSKMKRSAYLINTARGAVVQEKALIHALEEKQIAGAALDVFEKEPLPHNHPFFKIENVLLTPHMAWTGIETRQRVVHQLGEVIEKYLKGTPINKL